jgi:hypothetical protein
MGQGSCSRLDSHKEALAYFDVSIANGQGMTAGSMRMAFFSALGTVVGGLVVVSQFEF